MKFKKLTIATLAIVSLTSISVFANSGTFNGKQYEGNVSFSNYIGGSAHAFAWTKCNSGAYKTMAYVSILDRDLQKVASSNNNYSNTGWVQTEQITRRDGFCANGRHGYDWNNSFNSTSV